MSIVLVVDDDSSARRAMSELLVEEGYGVMEAATGRTATELLRVHRPSLLLTDLETPKVDGEGLIAHVRSLDPSLPILVLTSRLLVDAEREAARLRVAGYVNKPIDFDVLLDRIRRALATS